MRFADRREAGARLAERLVAYRGVPGVMVLALPRGGVPVAYEIATALELPLDVFIVRKLGVPGHEELAMGAIASGGVRVLNDEVLRMLRIPQEAVESAARREAMELARRVEQYRGRRAPIDVSAKTVILVDDGLATGSTMRVAVRALRLQGPHKIVVAVPVGAEDTCTTLRGEADEVLCLMTPEPFNAVGLWYLDFSQTTDEEVKELLGSSSPVL